MNEYQNKNGNNYVYGQPPQAPNFGAPMQPNGQPMPNQGFNGQLESGYPQPTQYYAPQQGNGQAQNQPGNNMPAQNSGQQGNGGDDAYVHQVYTVVQKETGVKQRTRHPCDDVLRHDAEEHGTAPLAHIVVQIVQRAQTGIPVYKAHICGPLPPA